MGGLSEDYANMVRREITSLLSTGEFQNLVGGILATDDSSSATSLEEKLWNSGRPLKALHTAIEERNADGVDWQLALRKQVQGGMALSAHQLLNLATCAELPMQFVTSMRDQVRLGKLVHSGCHLLEIFRSQLQLVLSDEHNYLSQPPSKMDQPVPEQKGRLPTLVLGKSLKPEIMRGPERLPAPRPRQQVKDNLIASLSLFNFLQFLYVEFNNDFKYQSLTEIQMLDSIDRTLTRYGEMKYGEVPFPKRLVVIFEQESSTNSGELERLQADCEQSESLKKHIGITLILAKLDSSQQQYYSEIIEMRRTLTAFFFPEAS